jgi:hypothetical protein
VGAGWVSWESRTAAQGDRQAASQGLATSPLGGAQRRFSAGSPGAFPLGALRMTLIRPDLARLVKIQLARWCERQGVPYQVLFPPEHLVAFAGRYSLPSLWPSLCVQQNDEKDIYATRGIKGLVDLGDGECQRVMSAFKDGVDVVATEETALRGLPALSVLIPSVHARACASLGIVSIELLDRYDAEAQRNVARIKERIRKMNAKLLRRDLSQREREASARSLADLNGIIGEVDSLNRRVSVLKTELSTTFAAGSAAPTAGKAAGLAKDLKGLLGEAFDLRQRGASKALAVMSCSIFDCSDKALSSLYFTPDDLKTWQLKEAIVRNALDLGAIARWMMSRVHVSVSVSV